ncbi:copper chaperone PCu(A)C [Streptacidiphilus carbonis]|uniref:copper chaperone PCu(A)C n=1 Tax=Streptacidiphilus carbonis TaxID=105422 RepID=UPI0005A669A2|nr:copper chaperone PCu(A)C [Streptacidiphilus carbonis]
MRLPRTALAGAAGAAVLAGSLALTACGGSGSAAGTSAAASPASISVSNAYIPLSATPDMAVAYFDISNTGGSADRLTGVSSPSVQSAALNRSTETSMEQIDGVDVPAHGSTQLARGGTHVMLMGLKPAPKLGQHVQLRLSFQHSGTVTVEATVQPLTYQPSSAPTPASSTK